VRSALSGVCINWCDVTPDPKPWGVNQHGAIFKWTATDLDNIRRTVQVSQLTQSSHLALQPPYFFGGLGRPSNYVDYLYMGLSVRNKEKGSSMFWSGIIPNSQVVTVPYPPEEPLSYVAAILIFW
jgi:integrin alpha FG-GAP repeat containing protein 1